MTYQHANDFLLKGRNKDRRPLTGRASEMVRRENGIAIKYHNTDVVTIRPDDSATLNSGGYRTMTTKSRINEYTLANIGQTKGLWYARGGSLFYDGMTIKPDGTPQKPLAPAKTEKTKAKLDRLCSAYVRAFRDYVTENKALPMPGNGDCWYCMMRTQDGKSFGEASGNVDHILSHLEEKYVHGSILWNAIQRRGNPHFCWQLAQSGAARGQFRIIDTDLSYYLRNLKPALLKLMGA